MQNSFPLSLSLSAVQLWSSCPLPPAVISCCVSVNEAACRFELLLKLQQFIFDTFLLVYVCVCVSDILENCLWHSGRHKRLQGIFLTINLTAAGQNPRQLHTKNVNYFLLHLIEIMANITCMHCYIPCS